MSLWIDNDINSTSGKHLHGSSSKPMDLLHVEELEWLDGILRSSVYKNIIVITKHISKKAKRHINMQHSE